MKRLLFQTGPNGYNLLEDLSLCGLYQRQARGGVRIKDEVAGECCPFYFSIFPHIGNTKGGLSFCMKEW